jgi:hypothetical protein
MTFELITQTDLEGKETELVKETITHTHQTVKFWTKAQLESKITEFDSTLERKTVLEEQLKRFKK